MRHFSPLPLAALAFALGCGDQPVTAPDSGPRGPRFGISDGAHSGGNDGFFFLPPVVKEPVGNPEYKDEDFHGGMKPHVRIWALPSAAPCLGDELPFKQFAPEQILVADEKYHVSWDTKEKPLVDDVIYRIVVCVGDVQLGYADVEHAPNRAELKNINTDEFVALVDGRTLPIKFRIETGALCQFDDICTSTFVDKDIGGTFYAADQGAAIDFSPGVLPVDVVLTIERIPVPFGAPCVTHASTSALFQQWEGCYRITTAPDIDDFGGFTGPTEENPARAIVAVCIEPGVPESTRENLLMYKFDGDKETPLQQPEPIVPPFAFPCDDFAGSPSGASVFDFARDAFGMLASAFTRIVGPRPLYAVDGGLGCVLAFGDGLSTFFWGLAVSATAVGDNIEGPVGRPLPNAPSVLVTSFHADAGHEEEEAQEPVSDVPVTFTVTGGGGTLVNALGAEESSVSVFTNSSGIASLPTGWAWRLGEIAGTNTVTASGPFENGAVTLRAESFVPVVTTLVSCSPEVRGGDQISRGWYIPSFPGVTLASVTLELSSRPQPEFEGSVAGTYTFELTARTSTYDGPVVGTSSVTVFLDGEETPVATTFAFADPVIPQGSLVTFSMAKVSGPDNAFVFYNVPSSDDDSCPIVQTNGTSPPLSTFRRQGIFGTIVGGVKPSVIE